MKEISVIIPSCKGSIVTVKSLGSYAELIVSRYSGLAFARNDGALDAKGDLLVFVDDDLAFSSDVWEELTSIGEREFLMLTTDLPITRVMSIHAVDFWRVGGFDETFSFKGEDHDFYFRALDKGLRFRGLPAERVYHFSHPSRTSNFRRALQACLANSLIIKRHFVLHPEILKVEFLLRLKRGQFRTVLIQFLMFVYQVLWRRK